MRNDPDLLQVVHEDAHLLVLHKPAGLLTIPGQSPSQQDCLITRAHQRWPDALIVHRLDMATSGLLLMGRGAEAQRRLSAAFAERRVAKRYTAVVAGQIASEEGQVALPLLCDWPNRPRQKVDPIHGKPALTRWRVLARQPAEDTTRLDLEPVTGRSHQLRVHLLAIGHPIVGDELYAPPSWQRAAPRLLLHATHVALQHPLRDETLEFSDPSPF